MNARTNKTIYLHWIKSPAFANVVHEKIYISKYCEYRKTNKLFAFSHRKKSAACKMVCLTPHNECAQFFFNLPSLRQWFIFSVICQSASTWTIRIPTCDFVFSKSKYWLCQCEKCVIQLCNYGGLFISSCKHELPGNASSTDVYAISSPEMHYGWCPVAWCSKSVHDNRL